jgi:sulfonate transport system substrate-binding protein
MNKKNLAIAVIALMVGFLIGYNLSGKNEDVLIQGEKELTSIKIGWQIPWATEGQLTQILKNTDLLKDSGLVGDFKGFSYGGPLNEAALAGEVDVIFTADQPIAMLLNKNPNWTIIGRLMYNRTALFVPPNSPIQDVAGLKGKTVAMPFGAAAQRMALLAQQDAGLDPKKDVININLGIYEQSDMIKDPEAKKWGNIDAMASFDPTPAILEEKGLVRNLKVGKIVSVIAMSNDYIEKNPEAPVNFLKAFRGAYSFYRNNVNQANSWFTAEAKLDMTPEALKIAASIEPNVNAESDKEIYIDFKEEDYAVMQEAADFLYAQELISKAIIMKDFVNLSYLEQSKK